MSPKRNKKEKQNLMDLFKELQLTKDQANLMKGGALPNCLNADCQTGCFGCLGNCSSTSIYGT